MPNDAMLNSGIAHSDVESSVTIGIVSMHMQ